jgi:hypothetical protein
LHVRDWKLFLEGQYEKEIAIAQLSPELTAYLGASSPFVHLQQQYAIKAVEKHQLGPEHMHLIFETVDYGAALVETKRPQSLTFLHFDAIAFEDWFQVSVKRGQEDRRIFVSTFHRSCDAEMRRKFRKHAMVRPARK